MKINTKFNLFDKIKINELNLPAQITAIFVNKQGIQYDVRFFAAGELKTCYFFEEEISNISETGKLGFSAEKV